MLVKKIINKSFSLSSYFIVLLFIGCTHKAYSSNINQDTYYNGFKKIAIPSLNTKDKFPAVLLYPTNIPSELVQFAPFKMNLSIGAKIANGKFPLVIFSHGSGGTNLGYRSIAFELVKNGYIVAIPLHPKNNFRNNSQAGTNKNWKDRPQHISATIDTVLSLANIKNHIDSNKIAVVGHSAGGYTALALAGGIPDTSHIIEKCNANILINEKFCERVKENKIKPAKILNAHDERIKTAVLMAPVGVLFSSKNSLDNVNIPVFMLRAEKDDELTEPYNAEMIYNNFKNKELLTYHTVKNAGHYSFITPFPEPMNQELGVIAKDPDGFNRRAFHDKLSADIVNYLDDKFK